MRLRLSLLILLWLPTTAHAGAWTRDKGHYFVSLGWARIAASSLFGTDYKITPALAPYQQQVVYFYGEVGLIDKLLTLTAEAQLYRWAQFEKLASYSGIGDLRLGLWSGLVPKPVRFSLGVIVGLPSGNPDPSKAVKDATPEQKPILALLPTGDGEFDVEARAALGYSFGGKRRWPVRQYLVAELGYWMRSKMFSDAVTWKIELGTMFPYRFIDRFWFSWHFAGLESFALPSQTTPDPTGLKNGVSYLSPGVDVSARIWRTWTLGLGIDSALRGRAVPAAIQLRLALSYQR